MSFTIRRLAPSDDRAVFRSGNVELDRFFERYAGQNQFRHHIGTTYVAVEADGAILGFATVAPSEIMTARLPKKTAKSLPAYPVPVLRLARLAVDEKARGRGIGNALLRDVLVLAQHMSVNLGCFGVVVDAKPEAVAFYERAGFMALGEVSGLLGERPAPLPMFLALGSIPK